MRKLIATSHDPLDMNGQIMVPSMMLPSFRYLLAKERKVEKNLLLISPGGLGDCVCMEPSVRFAIDKYVTMGFEISLLTEFPEVFSHLKLKEVFKAPEQIPDFTKYYAHRGYYDPDEINGEFFTNFNVQIVDYISMNLFKRQLPIEYKSIKLNLLPRTYYGAYVVIHAGKTWASKTLPSDYLEKIVSELRAKEVPVVIIGDPKRSVEFDIGDSIDKRGKCSILESASLCANASIVLTNDSSPLHFATCGNAYIGFFSTVKEPEYLMHWRKTDRDAIEFGWRMKNFTHTSLCKGMLPDGEGARFDLCSEEIVRSMLCPADDVLDWMASIINFD